MTATFQANLATARDRIRQRIGDTDVASAQVQDETIAAYLTMGLTELRTASRLCRDIAAKYARIGDINVDNQMSRTSKIYDHYISLAEEIEREEQGAKTTTASSPRMVVGGLTDTRGAISACDPL